MTLHSLDADQIDTDPIGYLQSLVPLAVETIGEIASAIDGNDRRKLRAACLRLTSIGALAGIIGRKLDAE